MMNILHNMHRSRLYSSPWLMHVKGIQDHCGLNNVWNTGKETNVEWMKNKVRCYATSFIRIGWDGIFGYSTSHEACCLCVGNHSGHYLHTRG